MKKEELPVVTVSIPLEGLDSNEKLCMEIVKNAYTMIQLEKDPFIIQKNIKSILEPLWGNLSNTGLTIEYIFAGVKDESLVTSIRFAIPNGKSILFLFNNKKNFPLVSVTINNFNSSDDAKIIGFAFFDTGFLSELWYANQHREVRKKLPSGMKKENLFQVNYLKNQFQ